MINRELAVALHAAGVIWTPAVGDRFSLIQPGFADDVFTLSDMTIESQGTADHQVLGFNGTTEWALDSVELRETLWLPREDQLRDLLGDSFLRLERRASADSTDFAVVVRAGETFPADDPADAYALALLARLAD